MADKETDLQLSVGAVADKGSAKKAVHDIVKEVDSSVKGGHIEVPIDITVPIDKSKSKLTKAQKDITSKLSKMMTKGFSASGKDIDDLTSKFNEFTKAFDQAGKGRQNKVFREIRKQVEDLQKQYKSTLKTTRTGDTKTNNTFSNKNIKKAQDQWTKEIINKQRKRTIAKTVHSTAPEGLPTDTSFNRKGQATEKSLEDSKRGGPYRTPFNQQVLDSKNIARKTYERETFTAETDKDKAEDLHTEAIKKSTRALTEQEKVIEKAGLAAKESAKELGAIEHDRIDADPEKFKMYTKGVMDYITQGGKSDWDSMNMLTNLTMNRYHGMNDDLLGVGYDKIKGEEKNHGEANQVLSDLMDTFTDVMSDSERALKAYEAQQRRILAQLKDWKGLEALDKNTSISEKTKSRKADKDNTQLIQELKKNQNTTETVATAVSNTTKAINDNTSVTNTQLSYDKIENSAERVADRTEGKKNQELLNKTEADLTSGFNTDAKADEAIAAFDVFKNIKDMMSPCEEILKSILVEIQAINKNGVNITGVQKGQTRTKSDPSQMLVQAQPQMQQALNMIRYVLKYGRSQDTSGDIQSSEISTTVKNPHSWITKLRDAFANLTKTTANYKVIMAKTSEEQDRMSADRIRKYGISRDIGPTDTGDKTMIARRLSLFRNKDYFKTLFKDISLTEGVKVDTTDITDKLAKALSGREMFKAQTGGWLKNILGAMTGGVAFAFQPSLEKSRSRAEGVNQIMANIRKVLNDTLQDIQAKESKLRGMRASGDLKLDAKGNVLESSSTEAKTLVLQLQESKDVLNSILADTKYVDEVVGKTHGRIGGIIKQLGFTSPALRENNKILANLNAGLDKTGKALKFHNRLAEILNYSFQLMGRHVGQIFKNLLLSLNPLNWIKRAFKDFESYNVKWQRTMNVIRYNLHSILEPFMDKIAQFLVNCIGFVDIISMHVQKAFGYFPISLFDQAAADSRKIKEELEQAANVTAGFDELHDIGSDNSGANDLLGDIYKPQLSKKWEDLAHRIGRLFEGLITGDMGFGEVMKEILGILKDGLSIIAKTIWDWFKQTAIGKFITDHWKGILATLLGIFLVWKLLKIAGKLLANALFGELSGSAFGGLLSKIGSKIVDFLGLTAFGRGAMSGILNLFTGGGGLLETLKSVFVGHEAITAFGAWGETLGAIFAQGAVAAIGIGIAGGSILAGGNKMMKNTAYNVGLEESGGKNKDKKSNAGVGALTSVGTIAGGAITGTMIAPGIGTVIGAAVGLVAGLLTTALAPAIEKITINAKDMNNEMLKIEQYEGRVKGAQTSVNDLDEMMTILNQTLESQTQNVYKEGDALGISRVRMDELVSAVQNGTFSTSMLSGAEVGLTDSLTQLSWAQENNAETSKKLTEAKRKLEKAELDLAIAQDIEAGNFELAEARIEMAMASGLYEGQEAAQKLSQITKEANTEMRKNLLDDMSPDMRKNWIKYTTETEKGKRDLAKLYSEMNEDERKAFSQSYEGEAGSAMQKAIQAMQNEINNTTWDWSHPFKSLMSKFTGDWSWKASYASFDVGTNYVPNDGFAYIHKGEAIIPADENVFADQGKAFSAQNITNEELLRAIRELNAQMQQGIAIKGQFIQRGSDLVATVEKANNKLSNNVLNNKVYAR